MVRKGRRLRLCFALNPRIRGHDNPENVLQLILKHVNTSNYEVGVVSGKYKSQLYKKNGFEVREISIGPIKPRGVLFVIGYVMYLFLQLFALVSQVRRTRPQVLISISGHVYSGLVTSISGSLTRTPTIIRISEPTSEIVKMKYAGGELISAVVRILENWVLLRSTAIVSNRSFSGQYPQRISDRIVVISQGVDPEIFRPSHYRSRLNPPTIVIVARFSEEKNYSSLLQAIVTVRKEVPDVRLRIIGAGPLEDEIRSFCLRLGLQNSVEFLGHIESQTELAAILADSDVFVLPSKQEGLPSVVLEAMACEIPVATGGLWGLGDAGLLENEHFALCGVTEEKIAESVLGLLRNRVKSLLMAKRARSFVLDNHTTSRCQQKFAHLIREVYRTANE